MKALFRHLLILVLFWVVVPASAQNTAPDALVRNTVDEVIAILKQDDGIKAGDQDRILSLVREKILPHFNFTRMTQLAMGRNWRTATNEQKKELVREFRTLLVRTYSNSLTNYRDEVIEVSPTKVKPEDTRAVVRAQVIQGRGRQPIPIDYSMEKTSDNWKVYDVTISGVSLVTNYRGSFNTQIRDGGVEGLIATLVERNESLKGQ
ncbi:MlaC/ttg2D family ABC transporter substrate-binding protein [Nitrosomonas halophila]|uniref:Phospholipid transport system substrate-binding protein n=1 Tax=Nitrosomonas halophila TaxID=44576 RepID=A0A1H3GI60_9PROT|nr:ABC transporter substrate-binding protein [Nitrosomonas halophila]SDY02981.1 phospholipid transport system substrate-binding protein [Nitrosomonas halophila]